MPKLNGFKKFIKKDEPNNVPVPTQKFYGKTVQATVPDEYGQLDWGTYEDFLGQSQRTTASTMGSGSNLESLQGA